MTLIWHWTLPATENRPSGFSECVLGRLSVIAPVVMAYMPNEENRAWKLFLYSWMHFGANCGNLTPNLKCDGNELNQTDPHDPAEQPCAWNWLSNRMTFHQSCNLTYSLGMKLIVNLAFHQNVASEWNWLSTWRLTGMLPRNETECQLGVSQDTTLGMKLKHPGEVCLNCKELRMSLIRNS